MDVRLTRKEIWLLLLFCTTAGLLASLWGYNYSAGNADEQLPFIFRALDPTWLSNDFFTNTFALYGPRTIYSEFIAFFARALPLTIVLFSFTFLANIAIAFFSSLTALHFFKDSKFGAYLAAAVVLTIKTFWLGYSNILYRVFLEPAQLAMPFLLLGFYLVLKKKWILSAFSFSVAALFHPLMGLETGWLLLGIAFLLFIIQVLRKQTSLKKGIPLFIAFAVLVIFSLGLLLPYSTQASISDDMFINIVAYVRHPHHYLPSTFDLWQYTQAAVFLAAFGIFFWLSFKRSETLRTQRTYLYMVGGAILLLCIGGYLFVEVWPSRLWTSAQMFRLPYLVKWFSLVLIAGLIGTEIDQPDKGNSKLFSLSAGLGLFTPVSIAVLGAITWIRQVLLPRMKLPAWLRFDLLTLLGMTALSVLYRPELRMGGLFLLLFGLVWFMFFMKWKPVSVFLSSTVLLAVSGLFVWFGVSQQAPASLKSEMPVFSLYDTTSEIAQVAEYAATNTPSDAIFLTPPKFGEFRYMAERAIVADFTAFPFQDEAMLEWYNRLVDCYGIVRVYGFNNIAEFNRVYRDKTDAELTALAQEYGADYVILFNSDKTDFPILFSTPSYKLARIPE